MTKGERAEIKRALEALAAVGWEVRYVDDGEARTKISTIAQALDGVDGLDDAWIYVAPKAGPKGGVIRVVFGNARDGSEVIADSSGIREIVAACWPGVV